MTPEEVKAATGVVFFVISLMIWIPLFVGLAIGNGYIAARLGKNVALWVFLSLIPGFNLIFIYYVGFYVVGRVLNRLNQIAEHVGLPAGPVVPS